MQQERSSSWRGQEARELVGKMVRMDEKVSLLFPPSLRVERDRLKEKEDIAFQEISKMERGAEGVTCARTGEMDEIELKARWRLVREG